MMVNIKKVFQKQTHLNNARKHHMYILFCLSPWRNCILSWV